MKTPGKTDANQADGQEVKQTMTPEHPQWDAFMDLLTGPEGCNFHKGKKGHEWNCGHGFERPLTKAILEKHFPQVDIEGSLAFFESHSGYCDCEIAFNVESSFRFEQKGKGEKPADEEV
jgi:hypothetical protein